MTIKVAVENGPELRFAVYHYSGHIDQASVLTSIMRAVNQFGPNQPYRELLIFEQDTNLSDFDAATLKALYRKCEELYRSRKLGKRTAVAMLDGSADAKMIIPLFNALSLVGAPDLTFELFTEVEPALNRLGIPLEEGLKIIARVA